MKKNVLTVNYNTQELTDACIKSVNKMTPDCVIYVFDNSDKESFVNSYENVTVLDNTKGQIIDFEKWLLKYPNSKKYGEATKICGSAKHCYTIEKCLSLIQDVLIKKDFSELYNKDYIYAGDVEMQPRSKIKRVFPFICYINSKMCLENNVHYFDEKKMHGLFLSANGNAYDTGAAFYLNAGKYPHKEFNYEEYVIHLKGGSWFDTLKEYTKRVHKEDLKISPAEWLNTYHYLWDETPIEEIPNIKPEIKKEDNKTERKPIVIGVKSGSKEPVVKKEEPPKQEEPQPIQEEAKVKPVLVKRSTSSVSYCSHRRSQSGLI